MSLKSMATYSQEEVYTIYIAALIFAILAAFGWAAWSYWDSIGAFWRGLIIAGYSLILFAVKVALVEHVLRKDRPPQRQQS